MKTRDRIGPAVTSGLIRAAIGTGIALLGTSLAMRGRMTHVMCDERRAGGLIGGVVGVNLGLVLDPIGRSMRGQQDSIFELRYDAQGH